MNHKTNMEQIRKQARATKKHKDHKIVLALCVSVSLWFTPIARAEVIDRIVAVVERHIITLGDVRQEREFRAQLGEKPIAGDAALARQLIDTYLIERQLADYPNIDVSDSEIDAEISKLGLFQVTAPGDKTGRALADAAGKILNISASGFREAIRRRIRIQKFIDLKFRPLIRPTDDDIRNYYEQVFLPEARTRGLQSVPPLTDPEMASAIRENVIQEKLGNEVDVWLEAIRRRSNIEVFE